MQAQSAIIISLTTIFSLRKIGDFSAAPASDNIRAGTPKEDVILSRREIFESRID
jgi:hypothetical protein